MRDLLIELAAIRTELEKQNARQELIQLCNNMKVLAQETENRLLFLAQKLKELTKPDTE
jgi:hypothetical protein